MLIDESVDRLGMHYSFEPICLGKLWPISLRRDGPFFLVRPEPIVRLKRPVVGACVWHGAEVAVEQDIDPDPNAVINIDIEDRSSVLLHQETVVQQVAGQQSRQLLVILQRQAIANGFQRAVDHLLDGG